MTEEPTPQESIEALVAWLDEANAACSDEDIGVIFHKAWPRISAELKRLRGDLEREQMRLAACGVAALGYFDKCDPSYISASLEDTLRLYEKRVVLEKERDHWKERHAKLREALEKYKGLEIRGRWEGGVFNPRLGCVEHEKISEWVFKDHATPALAEDDEAEKA